MNWKFWKKTADQAGGNGTKAPKSAKPKDLPEPVGRKLVVGMKLDPDTVWAWKYVSRPVEGRKNTSEFRIFDPNATRMAGLVARDWSSFDDHQELILYSGIFDKSASSVDIRGRA